MSVRAIRSLERGQVGRPRWASVSLLADALGLSDAERAVFREAAAGRGGGAGGPGAGGPGVAAVVGKAGVGKTALAVHAAHQVRAEFPDGQLYVNLHGAEAQALATAEVLGRCLRALG